MPLKKTSVESGGNPDAIMAELSRKSWNDRNAEALAKSLPNEGRPPKGVGVYAWSSGEIENVVDPDFALLSSEEQMRQFEAAQMEKGRVDDVDLKPIARAETILELDSEEIASARESVRALEADLKKAHQDAEASFKKIQDLQSRHTTAVARNSPDLASLDSELSAEVEAYTVLEESILRNEQAIAAARKDFKETFGVPYGNDSPSQRLDS